MKTGAEAAMMHAVRGAARRLTALAATAAATRAAVWLLGTLVALTAAGSVTPVPPVSWRDAVVGTALLALVVTAAVFAAGRVPMTAAARALDHRLRLDERASTALEVTLAPHLPTAFGERVIDDAGAHLAGVDLRAAIPWRVPRRIWWIPALVLILAVWPLYVAGLAIPGTPAYRTRQVVRQEGARLEQFAQQMEARARAQRLPQARRTAPQMRDLGMRLQQDRVDRAGALARIGELSRQIEAARQRLDQRIDEVRRPQTPAGLPPDLLRREALQRQIRQLEELTSRLREPSAAARDMLHQLGAITREGEGNRPADVQQQLRQAMQRLEEGDTAGAGEALTHALRQLEGLEALIADREGLADAQEQLERSRAAIAAGRPGASSPEDAPGALDQASPAGPGDQPVAPQDGADAAQPPEGPREGSTPGRGRGDEQVGPTTPRLEVERTPQRVRGVQGEGEVSASEVVGAGRPGTSRVRPGQVTPAFIARADRAMERARVPAHYRQVVRRYFERLAKLR